MGLTNHLLTGMILQVGGTGVPVPVPPTPVPPQMVHPDSSATGLHYNFCVPWLKNKKTNEFTDKKAQDL